MSMDLGTLLVRSPDICGGRLRIDGTRMTVNQVVVWYKQGLTAEEIADQYPHLTLAQIYTSLAYYHANRDEIEAELAAEKIEADQLEQAYQQPLRRT
jgi:uncharacterized protein (DUF433 family)